MDSGLIRTFVAVCERGSFRAAADDVSRTQSAVSQQIKRLEDQIGVRLLERSTRSVLMTRAGEEFYEHACRLLASQQEAVAAARGVSRGRRLRVGVTDDIAAYALVRCLEVVEGGESPCSLDLETASSQSLRSNLGRRHDIVVVVTPHGSRFGELVASLPLVWLGSEEKASADIVELAVFGDRCAMRDAAVSALDRAGRKWTTRATVSGLLVIEAVVRARLAVAPALTGLHAADLTRTGSLPALPELEIRIAASDEVSAGFLPVIRDELATTLRG